MKHFVLTLAAPAAGPTTTTAPATELMARVVHVTGYGEVRTSPRDPWGVCKDGMVLGEGMEHAADAGLSGLHVLLAQLAHAELPAELLGTAGSPRKHGNHGIH